MMQPIALRPEIITSSLWSEPHCVRIVFITMLAAADNDGVIHASIGGLAHLARVTHEECEEALGILCSPDDDSRTPDHEGRRIARVDGGWRLLNWTKYQATTPRRPTTERRKAYMREYMQQRRAGQQQQQRDKDGGSELLVPAPGKPKEPQDNKPTTPEALFVADLFNRRHSTGWSNREIRVFKDAVKRGLFTPENMSALQRYYDTERAKGGNGIHRRDLATFLNNIDGEIDRAHSRASVSTRTGPNHATHPQSAAASSANSGTTNAKHADKY